MKMRINRLIVSVYIHLFHLYGSTLGQVFERNEDGRLGFDGKIVIRSSKVWIKGVSIDGCVDECKLRLSCTAVNYHRFNSLCELNFEPNPLFVSTKGRGLLYRIKPKKEKPVECGIHTCKSGYVCNTLKNTCEVKECSPLSPSDGTIILGNVNAIGLRFRCVVWYVTQGSATTTLTCGTDGFWSQEPLLCCPPESRQCKPGWTRFEHSCYLFGDTDVTFNGAHEYCAGLDASQVQIHTAEKNMFLREVLMTTAERNGQDHWIGITDEAKEGTWTYLDGEEVSITFWGSLQPNNGRKSNCGVIWSSFNSLWVDEPCTREFKAISEALAIITC